MCCVISYAVLPSRVSAQNQSAVVLSPEVKNQIANLVVKGKTEVDNKNFSQAAALYEKAADLGDVSSMYELGQIYSAAYGADQFTVDHSGEAEKWYKQAAVLGNAAAMYNYGFIIFNRGFAGGAVHPEKFDEALPWFQKSADLGYPPAIGQLGVMYKDDGLGDLPHDNEKAAKYFLQAAQLGNPLAMGNLGLMYARGKGVPRNHAQAIYWWKQAVKADPQGPDGKAAQTWLDANDGKPIFPSLSTASNTSLSVVPVEFSVGNVHYKIPKNYIAKMDNLNGGPQTLVQIQVSFPDLKPYNSETKKCFTLAAAYRPSGCIPIKVNVISETPASDDEGFNNMRGVFKSQQSKAGPDGFEWYETGPDNARIDTYRKKTPSHTLVIECFDSNIHEPLESVCNTHSRLPSGNAINYIIDGTRFGFDGKQFDHIEQFDAGIRALIQTFTVTGEKQ